MSLLFPQIALSPADPHPVSRANETTGSAPSLSPHELTKLLILYKEVDKHFELKEPNVIGPEYMSI